MANIRTMSFDAVIVGGGGSGMRAALQLAQSGYKTAVITKVFPTRSHTVSAQGGITCAIASDDPNDQWQWHMYDTIKGSDYIGDQEAIEYMCQTGPEAIFELEHMGLPFSRTESGRIYQRPFGGQSKDFGNGGQAARTCAAADRTGHALLHTLYQGNLKNETVFLNEWFAVDIVKNSDNAVVGVVAINIETGETVYVKSKATVFATGGAGRIYASTTNAHICTGDGIGMALRAGFPVQDIEMWQFHPTGIAGAGTLVTEGCRGEGGYLVNKDGERFMERYAPNAKDLAGRDVVARSMVLEILEGRGCGPNGDHVYLKLDHLGEETLNAKLPGILELSRTFAHADPVKEPIPVVPTCHYMMGGIPTNIKAEVLSDNDTVIPGLYAAGECACVSVHGANRLGTNSLLDINVFGKRAGQYSVEYAKTAKQVPLPENAAHDVLAMIEKVRKSKGKEKIAQLRKELQDSMDKNAQVFRTEETLQEAMDKIQELRKRYENIAIQDQGKRFNTDLLEAIELGFLLDLAEVTVVACRERRESRGAHLREDFPNRDDKKFMVHSMAYLTDKQAKKPGDNIKIDWKPVTITNYPPMERKY